jgi:hypothetical protein
MVVSGTCGGLAVERARLLPCQSIGGRIELVRLKIWRGKILVFTDRWRTSMVCCRQDSSKGEKRHMAPIHDVGKGTSSCSFLVGGEKVSGSFLSIHHSHLGFSTVGNPRVSPPRNLPNLGWIERVCGWRKDLESGWKGTTSGDCRSFSQVVRVKLTPTTMVPPCLNQGGGEVVSEPDEVVGRAELGLKVTPSIIRYKVAAIFGVITGRIFWGQPQPRT